MSVRCEFLKPATYPCLCSCRLKATGVVDVKNPLQQAVEEGRFEELDDDDDDDDDDIDLRK